MPYVFALLVALNAMYLGFSLLKDSRGDPSIYTQTAQQDVKSNNQDQ